VFNSLICICYFIAMTPTEIGCTEIGDHYDDEDDIVLLTEADIPGASLDGKDRTELNIPLLKRWLVCRGAPINGRKPELIQW